MCGTRQSISCIMIHIPHCGGISHSCMGSYDVERQLLYKFIWLNMAVTQNLAKPYILLEPNWLKLIGFG